ncbi:DUF397 domain-containing protein [Actinokineospora sp.]|uniref:DUF397 domain-containing protein n=1 Tax=Actinokineospora sp. TaxID=1872133 RepID=UPI0040384E20
MRLANVTWVKSSRSNGQAECVEVAFLDEHQVATRDSKQAESGPVLFFGTRQWYAFIRGASFC